MGAASSIMVSPGFFAVAAVSLTLLSAGGDATDAVGASPEPRRITELERGRALFDRHCSVCHGAEGRGDGKAACLLYPAPRNFASGKFRLVSTSNGVPTQGDLIETIRTGMPGSTMPPWEWLAEEDLWSLALYVRYLTIEGLVGDLMRWAAEEDDDISLAEARAIIDERMTPGDPIEVGRPSPSDPVTLHEGRRLFMQTCAACHGVDGTGNAPVNLAGELKNEDGTPSTARDFTAGIFKGGATHADIVRRISGGLPGSPMPATDFEDPTDVGALTAFVLSLVKPGAQDRVRQRRTTVPVARVPGRAPRDPADPAWSRAEGVWISLMPLWWRDQRIEGVVVRALHDGETIVVRLSWRDPSYDKDLLGAQSFSDGAAIEISVERDPPLFAMGAADHPVDIALWRAAWEADGIAARDVRDRYPDMVDDGFPDLVGDLREQSITARAVQNSQSLPARPSGAEALMAEGFGTVGPRTGAPSSWTARSTWEEGYWDVVFSRSMNAEIEGEPALSAGLSAFLAFAIWDGAFDDRNGQKSVSVWHRLQVAP
ncbi:MAG: c-type cytochrome [Planctomycetota bacterium]|nr:MAG: c-type cytochrome [Planctomycetota bacterium]